MSTVFVRAHDANVRAIDREVLVKLTMTPEQQIQAVRAILGTFTAEAVTAFLVAEYCELVEAKE